MKISDYETSTRIEFKPPRSFGRQQRLKLVATAYAHLTEWTSPLPLCERVEGLHDHKGDLEVHWIMQPTEQDMRQWNWLWKHLCFEPCTRHYWRGTELRAEAQP
jgi:hypothetical protein